MGITNVCFLDDGQLADSSHAIDSAPATLPGGYPTCTWTLNVIPCVWTCIEFVIRYRTQEGTTLDGTRKPYHPALDTSIRSTDLGRVPPKLASLGRSRATNNKWDAAWTALKMFLSLVSTSCLHKELQSKMHCS